MNKRAQVAPFLVVIIAVLLLAIVATRIIGEAGFQRIRMANVADGALITAASNFSKTLNQIRKLSLGAGGLMVNYVGLQTLLLAHRDWCYCPACATPVSPPHFGWFLKMSPYWNPTVLMKLNQSRQIFEKAKEYAKGAPKSLRVSLYESTLGGALVDEPKPFRLGEDILLNEEGRVTEIKYDTYLRRKSHFEETLKTFKVDNRDNWYNREVISYSWNKSGNEVISQPGVINAGGPNNAYQAYLEVASQNPPGQVTVIPQIMPMFYLWYKAGSCTPAGVCTCVGPIPGIMPHPWAWISAIHIDSTSFGLSLRKKVPFTKVPFFGQEVGSPELRHRNRVRIQGSVWSGFEPKMEE